jgi:ribosomal protein S18 acetylase RimI-like enzyme
MKVVFDIPANTPPIDKRLKQEFKGFSRRNRRYNLVIDGKVVGGVDIEYGYEDSIANLFCLEIYRPFRNKGYGKILLEEAEKICKDKKKKWMSLNVDPKNTYAIKLYEKQGIMFTEKYLYGEMIMSKLIS